MLRAHCGVEGDDDPLGEAPCPEGLYDPEFGDAGDRVNEDEHYLLATAERERDQMLTQARQTADRIRSDTRLLAAQEAATARRTLRDEVIAAAVREGTALVRQTAQPQDQERFVREFIGSAGATS